MTTAELRELDAWIAEEVFEWHQIVSDSENNCIVCGQPCGSGLGHYSREHIHLISRLPHYTTDPAAAMEVLEKCAENCISEVAIWGEASLWHVGRNNWYYEKVDETVTAPTLPLAICLFARKLFTT